MTLHSCVFGSFTCYLNFHGFTRSATYVILSGHFQAHENSYGSPLRNRAERLSPYESSVHGAFLMDTSLISHQKRLMGRDSRWWQTYSTRRPFFCFSGGLRGCLRQRRCSKPRGAQRLSSPLLCCGSAATSLGMRLLPRPVKRVWALSSLSSSIG